MFSADCLMTCVCRGSRRSTENPFVNVQIQPKAGQAVVFVVADRGRTYRIQSAVIEGTVCRVGMSSRQIGSMPSHSMERPFAAVLVRYNGKGQGLLADFQVKVDQVEWNDTDSDGESSEEE